MLLEEFRKQQPSQGERAYVLLASLFIGVLLLTNVITSKYITVFHLTFTAGAITYPFTFSLLDIITEVYGKTRAKMVIWMGLVASLFMIFITYIANIIPVYEHSPISQKTFEAVFGFTPGIVLGSMTAYLISQFIDIYLFELSRRLTRGKHLWIRNNISTLVGQLIDTAIFGSVAWMLWPRIGFSQALEPITWGTWYRITLNEYGFKVIFTFFNIPLVYLGVYLVRRYIKVDSISLLGKP
jgi:uncharacterized integral membrane protein (TIGR00697 family)